MAFAPIYGFETNITAATAANAGQIQIDPNVAAQLVTQLGGNFTYASLSDGVNYEIIRIDSVNPPNLVVTRGQDGTTSSAFPKGACIRFVWTQEGIAAVASGATITLTGTGACVVTQTGPSAWTLSVATPLITGTAPIEVLGAYPVWEIATTATNTGCCCSGSSGGGSSSGVQTLTGLGIASATVDGSGNGTVTVSPPNFIGAGGLTITGSWPTYTFTQTGGGGGGVTSITGSAKILLSGPSTSPTISLATTGVGAGTYNGITYDSYGTITAVNTGYVPITTLSSANAGITVAGAGGSETITLIQATTSAIGGVILAPATAVGTNNPADSTSAVTPAGINALLNSGVIASTAFNGGGSTLASGSYTTTTTAALTISVGSNPIFALVRAVVGVMDSTPGSVPNFGIAIFNGASIVTGTNLTLSGQSTVEFKMNLSATANLTLKTTALTGTQTIEWASLSAVITES